MSFNSSNSSLLPPHLLSSNSSLNPASHTCFFYRSAVLSFNIFCVTNILLLLPLCIFVFYLGLRRWQKQRSTASMAATSHSDIFTYHMVAMEMIGLMGCGFFCVGTYFNVSWMISWGARFISIVSTGQLFFHVLTCVERYLAVVHPIIYLGLRERGGVRIRNIIIGCVWLLSLGWFSLTSLLSLQSMIPNLCFLVLSLMIVSFCSVSVLCALIRPGPGEGGGNRDRVDQSKMRAFHIIMAIMGAMLFRVGGHMFVVAIFMSRAVSARFMCGVLMSGVWFSLPSNLVLPLLFLHRAGKLLCCKNNTESGQGSE